MKHIHTFETLLRNIQKLKKLDSFPLKQMRPILVEKKSTSIT